MEPNNFHERLKFVASMYCDLTIEIEEEEYTHIYLITEEYKYYKRILDKYTDALHMKLGCYNHENIKIRLKEDVRPIHKKPYDVPLKQDVTST